MNADTNYLQIKRIVRVSSDQFQDLIVTGRTLCFFYFLNVNLLNTFLNLEFGHSYDVHCTRVHSRYLCIDIFMYF